MRLKYLIFILCGILTWSSVFSTDSVVLDKERGYWKKWNEQLVAAKKCDSVKKTANFLSAVSNLPGASGQEEFGEEVEPFIVNNPRCFLDAALTLDVAVQKKLVYHLQQPITDFGPKIIDAFKRVNSESKYKQFIALYFDSNCCKPIKH